MVHQLNCTDVKTLVLLSLSFRGLSTLYKSTPLYLLSVQQTVLGATCTLSCHPEDDHHDVHHHPAAADWDHPNQGHLQEVQEQHGGKSSSQVQETICTGGAITVPPKPTSVRTLCLKT